MIKLIILLTVVLITGFSAIELMAASDDTFSRLQEQLWVEGVESEELERAHTEEFMPEELFIALEKDGHKQL